MWWLLLVLGLTVLFQVVLQMPFMLGMAVMVAAGCVIGYWSAGEYRRDASDDDAPDAPEDYY